MVICSLPIHEAVELEGPFLRLVRNRRKHVTRAYISCLPGFMRHVIAMRIQRSQTEIPIPHNYGVSFRQELETGHVLWAFQGVEGSGCR
jgi:hypothetical protein